MTIPVEEDKKGKESIKKKATPKPIKTKKEEKPQVIWPVPIRPQFAQPPKNPSTNVTTEDIIMKVPFVVPSCA